MSLAHRTEKAMAPPYSILAWKIPWTEEPGWLQSMGSRRVGHDCSDLAAAAVWCCGCGFLFEIVCINVVIRA